MTDLRGILPAKDGRALVVGMSGSGKTTLMQAIMREIERDSRVIITDPKAEWKGRQYTLITRPIELRWEWRYPILFRPDPHEFDNPELYEPIFKVAWQRKNLTLYNDEIMFMGSRPTRSMRAIMSQGRSRGIRVINGTQRPADIPTVAFTEANAFYAFYLSKEDDVRRVRQVIPEYNARELEDLKARDPDNLFPFYFKRLGKPARIHYLER